MSEVTRLFALTMFLRSYVVDKIIKRIDVLFDESFDFEERGKEEPFVLHCLDWIRKTESSSYSSFADSSSLRSLLLQSLRSIT